MVKDNIVFSAFAKLDIRIGKVVKAEKIKGSDNLLRLNVDLGKEYGTRKILSGISRWYKPELLKGKKFMFIANLEPKEMMGEESQGMIMAADMDGRAFLIPVKTNLKEGTIVR